MAVLVKRHSYLRDRKSRLSSRVTGSPACPALWPEVLPVQLCDRKSCLSSCVTGSPACPFTARLISSRTSTWPPWHHDPLTHVTGSPNIGRPEAPPPPLRTHLSDLAALDHGKPASQTNVKKWDKQVNIVRYRTLPKSSSACFGFISATHSLLPSLFHY